MKGRHRGKAGWIAGDLQSRRARGITKALVHVAGDVELIELSALTANDQLSLFAPETQKDPPPA